MRRRYDPPRMSSCHDINFQQISLACLDSLSCRCNPTTSHTPTNPSISLELQITYENLSIFRRYRNNRHNCCHYAVYAPRASSEETLTMRQITAMTVLVLVLLFVFVASRLLDATASPSATRMDKTDSSANSTLPSSERLGSGNPPNDSAIKAGGIWFW